MTPTILNCPFCDYDQVEIGEIEPGRYAVDCPDCQCIGPFGDSMEEAIAKWNAAHDKNLGMAKAVREINAFEAVNGVMADSLADGGRY